MAWNPSPEVAAARDFGKKFNADRVIIIYTNPRAQIGCATYGRTRALCNQTKGLGDVAYEAVRAAVVKQMMANLQEAEDG